MDKNEAVKVLEDRLESKKKEFAKGVDILSGTEKVGKWASLKYEIQALTLAIDTLKRIEVEKIYKIIDIGSNSKLEAQAIVSYLEGKCGI